MMMINTSLSPDKDYDIDDIFTGLSLAIDDIFTDSSSAIDYAMMIYSLWYDDIGAWD